MGARATVGHLVHRSQRRSLIGAVADVAVGGTGGVDACEPHARTARPSPRCEPRRRLLRRTVVAGPAPVSEAPIQRWASWALLGDAVAAVVAASAARAIDLGFDESTGSTSGAGVPNALVGLALAALWPVATSLAGAYGYRVALFAVEELRRLLRAGTAMLAGVGVVHFIVGLDMSRRFVGVFIPTAVVLSGLWRSAVRARIGRDQTRGVDRHRAVVVGALEDVQRVQRSLATVSKNPIEVVAYVSDDAAADAPPPNGLEHVHRLQSREAIATMRAAGMPFDLVLRAGQPDSHELWQLARIAHHARIGLAIAPERSDNANVALTYVPLGATPLLVVQTPALSPSHLIIKGLFDRVMAAVLVVALSPVLLGIAAAILVSDGRPVLFRQRRVGRDGIEFDLWKFRTMSRDAEARRIHVVAGNIAGGPLFKVRDDPRVTSVGRWLRRHSLDELPQLLNVLRGEMSLVGPRPPLPAEVAAYDERAARRLLVKPGMTGLWQVQGRSDLPWDESVYLDLLYIDHWSPLLDVVILAKTARTVVSPRGAY